MIPLDQPDLEAHLAAALAPLEGVTSWCYAAERLPAPGRWLVGYSCQVDCRARGKERARWRADQAIRIIGQLPDAPWGDGQVCGVDWLDGPLWLPDEDGGPRYAVRVEIRARPARSVLRAQPAAAGAPLEGTTGKETSP